MNLDIKSAISRKKYGAEFVLNNETVVILVKAYKYLNKEGTSKIDIVKVLNKNTWTILSDAEVSELTKNI